MKHFIIYSVFIGVILVLGTMVLWEPVVEEQLLCIEEGDGMSPMGPSSFDLDCCDGLDCYGVPEDWGYMDAGCYCRKDLQFNEDENGNKAPNRAYHYCISQGGIVTVRENGDGVCIFPRGGGYTECELDDFLNGFCTNPNGSDIIDYGW